MPNHAFNRTVPGGAEARRRHGPVNLVSLGGAARCD
jgi:hypothetical protein